MRFELQYSPLTVQHYDEHILRFAKYLAALLPPVTDWRSVSAHHIRAFLGVRRAAGNGAKTIHNSVSSLRVFFAFLLRESHVTRNPTDDVISPPVPRPLPDTLSIDEVNHLLDFNVGDPDPLAVRDRAMMELLYSSGLRVSELVGLDINDVHDDEVRVRFGKGRKTRVVPVGRKAREALKAWMRVRRRFVPDACAVLFTALSPGGRRLHRRTVNTRIAHWAQKSRLGRHVHPHLFRHAVATHLLERSRDIRVVQEFLGHEHISTTQVYTHVDFAHLARTYDATHPRARRSKITPQSGSPDDEQKEIPPHAEK